MLLPVFLIGIVFIMLILIILLFYVEKGNKSKSKTQHTLPRAWGIRHSTWFQWHKKISNLFLTRKQLIRITQQLAELSIYTREEVKIYATQFFLIANFAMLSVILMGAVLMQDFFITIIIGGFALVLRTIIIDKQIDRIHFQLIKQLDVTLSNIRQAYLRVNVIPDAIAEAEAGPLVKHALDDIHTILTSTNSQQRLDAFYSSTPFKLLQTLAGVCYLLNDAGDTRLADGTSNFILAMNMLSEEVRLEVRKISYTRMIFGNAEIMPLICIPMVGGLERFFFSCLPGTTNILKGIFGYASKCIIVFASFGGYYMVANANHAHKTRQDDRPKWAINLLTYELWKTFIDNIKPKADKRKVKKVKLLKGSLSLMDIDILYTLKSIYASIAFVTVVILTFLIIVLGKNYVYQSVTTASLAADNGITQEMYNRKFALDCEVLALKEQPTKSQVLEIVKARFGDFDQLSQEDEATRIYTKYKNYHNSYYHWYYLFIAYIGTFIGWIVPDKILSLRAKMLKLESEEDVLQLQTIIAILMYTPLDTLDTLYWLEKQSEVHKSVLLECYHEYPSNPEFALANLKHKVVIEDFKRIIDKLTLTIHQISLVEAFSDLVSERNHIMRMRETQQEFSIKKKRQQMSTFIMAPLGLTLALYIVAPIGILAYNQAISVMSSLPM